MVSPTLSMSFHFNLLNFKLLSVESPLQVCPEASLIGDYRYFQVDIINQLILHGRDNLC